MPATPMATSVRPSRQGLPKVSVMMTGMERCRTFFSALWIFAAERSGSLGSRRAWRPPSTLETSTALLAQISP